MILFGLYLRKRNILVNTITVEHYHDLGKFLFAFIIFWGYIGFSQYFLIWYANIPEETVYFLPRMRGEGWNFYFYANILINWFLPFVLLMPKATARNRTFLKIVIPFLIVGQFIDLYVQIFPGTVGQQVLGFQEIGTFVGFAGLFMLVTGWTLSRAGLYAVNHPFLDESKNHHT